MLNVERELSEEAGSMKKKNIHLLQELQEKEKILEQVYRDLEQFKEREQFDSQ
jgi:hypothetical protein